jgi:hypothetical protein
MPNLALILWLLAEGALRIEVRSGQEPVSGATVIASFRYYSVALARLPAEECVGTNPLGAALSVLMKKRRDRAALMASMLKGWRRAG